MSTISSILAGWILPSSRSFSRDFFAIYLLKRSNAEINTVSGVSSMISATQVALSNATIFLPSFPINFHFMSSFGS
jgi:hypothetical protein